MAIKYPWIIIIAVILIILVFVLFRKKTLANFKKGKKVSNSKLLEKNPVYKRIILKYRILVIILYIIFITSIIASSILSSRIIEYDIEVDDKYNRDIVLCMDVSYSVNDLNQNIVSSMKDIVKSLEGERFAVSIFNTSSVLVVPLTDDYDYINEQLDLIEDALKTTGSTISSLASSDYLYLYSYLYSGTIVDNETRGSSLIGDGLASCMYDFSKLEADQERSRTIIFSTDNDVEGEELISLNDAAKLCKKKNIKVYGLAPKTMESSDLKDMKESVELTGGSFYQQTTSSNIKSIVKNINKEEKKKIEEKQEVKEIDKPTIPFITMLISFALIVIISKKVEK